MGGHRMVMEHVEALMLQSVSHWPWEGERESSQDGDGVGVKPLCWVICRKYKWSRKSKLNHKQKRCADGLV